MFRVHFWPWKQPISTQGPFCSSPGAFEYGLHQQMGVVVVIMEMQMFKFPKFWDKGNFKRSDKNRKFEHLHHKRTSADEDHVL